MQPATTIETALDRYDLPSACYGRCASADTRVQINREASAQIGVRDPDADEPGTAYVAQLPERTRAVTVQGRLCGDWYAEIEGDRFHVSAIGPHPKAALLNAIGELI